MNSITYNDTTLLRDLEPLLKAGDYLTALDLLRQELTQIRERRPEADWRTFCAQSFSGKAFGDHPLARLLKDGPLGSGCTGTAHGLMHEPLILDVIYGLDRVSQELTTGEKVFRAWELGLGFCVSLRARHQLFARELSDLGDNIRSPRVFAVGCGHLRDAAKVFSLENMRDGEIVAFDRDRACIDLIEREYDYPGLRTVSGSLRDLTIDSRLGKFDFIYVPTLLDTLEDFRVEAMLNSLLPLLKAGGRLLAANFSRELRDAAYLEACLAWWPYYRGEEEWAVLLGQLAGQNLRGHAIFRDDSGGSVFIDLQAT